MNGWTNVLLGVIALATFVMAAIQVGVIVYSIIALRRLIALVERLEKGVEPLMASARSIGADASRASSLMVAQVERADQVLGGLSDRADQLAASLQASVSGPTREGMAIWAGLRAALSVFRDGARRTRRVEDDDALFI